MRIADKSGEEDIEMGQARKRTVFKYWNGSKYVFRFQDGE